MAPRLHASVAYNQTIGHEKQTVQVELIALVLKKQGVYAGCAEYIPMVDKLMDSSIIRANMGFGQLPRPIAGGVDWWCDYPIWPWRALWEAELYSYGFEGSSISQEVYSSCCI